MMDKAFKAKGGVYNEAGVARLNFTSHEVVVTI